MLERRRVGPVFRATAILLAGQLTAALAVFLLGLVTFRLLGPGARGVVVLATFSATLGGTVVAGAVLAVAREHVDATAGSQRPTRPLWPAVALGSIIASLAFVLLQAGAWACLPAVAAYPLLSLPVSLAYARALAQARATRIALLLAAAPVTQLAGATVAAATLATPTAVVWAWVIGLGSVSVVCLRNARGPTSQRQQDPMGHPAKLGLSNTLMSLSRRADLALLGVTAGDATVGIYSVALTVGQAALTPATAAASALFRRLVKGQSRTPHVALVVAGGLFVGTLVLACIVAPLLPFLLPLLFGPEAEAALQPALLALAAATLQAPLVILPTIDATERRGGRRQVVAAISYALVTVLTFAALGQASPVGAAASALAGASAALLAVVIQALLIERIRRREQRADRCPRGQ